MFNWEYERNFYNSIFLTIQKADEAYYDKAVEDLKNNFYDEELEGIYDELYKKFTDLVKIFKKKGLDIYRCDKSYFKYKVKSPYSICCICNNVKFAVISGCGIYWEIEEKQKISTITKIAKSGYNYLQIKKEGVKQIITIFETDKYIFDYIYNRLNIVDNGFGYDLGILESYVNDDTYNIFLEAFISNKEINSNGYSEIDENPFLYDSLCQDDYY
jgi:hypothetical protein